MAAAGFNSSSSTRWFPAGVIPSSVASASVSNAAAPQAIINSDDVAWAHCFCPDANKKHWLKCKYCDKLCKAGITRIKWHLAGINLSNKVQTTLSTQKREERRDKACEYICQFFYEASIAHNTVTLPSFALMLEAIGQFGKAVNFFEPLANVLRRLDSDVPAMGFFHGLMLEAKKEISERFDNDESRYKVAWDIIDKRWDSKLKTPLHLAGYYLNPYFYYPKKSEIEHDGSFRAGVINCITKMIGDEETQDKIIEELYISSACERNWSVFEQVHTKRRNRLLHDRMRDLVFVKFNSKLRGKKERIDRDPLEREVDDVVGDDDNEFITGIVPLPNDVVEPAQDGRSQGEQTSQAQVQVQAKRKRSMKPRKKLRSLQSLMRDV
ncbi:hAT transposon superfamily protein [Zea mays]|uniref:HAT transposon superfamily protein n=1 Tax=Zea mays TaxID=4577 RepID=A0A1D6F8J2_MAIZE|nr:hAT transposon superfamily protein [Zea mays]